MTGLLPAVFAAWDFLSGLGSARDGVTHAAGLVGELSAERFDGATIAEADTAVELMYAAASAAQEAGVSADTLLNAISEF